MLQIDLEAFDGDYVSLIYDNFKIGGEEDNYRLHVSSDDNHRNLISNLNKLTSNS